MGILSLDPGLRGCGVACFEAGHLTACAYLKNSVLQGDGPEAVLSMARIVWSWAPDTETLIFEHPRVYTASKSKGDNNDLMPLVAIGYVVASQFSSANRVYPHEWKGSMKKSVCNRRVLGRLTIVERSIVERAVAQFLTKKTLDEALSDERWKGHNVLDAVGIGLHQVERFERHRVWRMS